MKTHIFETDYIFGGRWMSKCAESFGPDDTDQSHCRLEDLELCNCSDCLDIIVTLGEAAQHRIEYLKNED